jgi:uncharacterized protein YceH (UPF0502 family)
MEDRRRVPRLKSLLRGRIYYNNRNSTADCLVRDISSHGARLAFADDLTIPDVVELYVPQREQYYRSHIVWRHGSEAGIAFSVPEQATEPNVPGDLAARVAKLEHEIELLKRMIRRLKTDVSPGGDSEAA